MDKQTSLKTEPGSRAEVVSVRDFARAYVEGSLSVMSQYNDSFDTLKKNPFVHEFFRDLFQEMINRGVNVSQSSRLYYPITTYGPVTLGNNGVPPFRNAFNFPVVEFYMPKRDEGYCVRLSKRVEGVGVEELVDGVISDIGSLIDGGLSDIASKSNGFSGKVNLPAAYVSDNPQRLYGGISHVPEGLHQGISISRDASKEDIQKFIDHCRSMHGLVLTDLTARYYHKHPEELPGHLDCAS